MKVLHLSYSDNMGGAARSAYRIHQSLVHQGRRFGVSSRMKVREKSTNDQTVLKSTFTNFRKIYSRAQPHIANISKSILEQNNNGPQSIAWPSTGLLKEIQVLSKKGEFDVLNLHWLGDSTLSIEEIGRLPRRVAWTLHDQWAFCGSKHYTNERASIENKHIGGRARALLYRDLERLCLLRKKRSWKPMTIICPSNWLADCARQSEIMHEWPVHVIPYPISPDRFKNLDKDISRNKLGLPQSKKLILFGAQTGTTDRRKGFDLLEQSLEILWNTYCGKKGPQEIEIVIFGSSSKDKGSTSGFKVHDLGKIDSDEELSLLYSAADLVVIPSRQDNLPNIGLEAHACGVPVAGFQIGGLSDIVTNTKTGLLASPFSTDELSEAMRIILENDNLRQSMSREARLKAELLWCPKVIAKSYSDVYKEMMLKS